MDHDPSRYEAMFEDAGIDGESLTVLLVRGGTSADVLRLLGAEAEADLAPYPDLEDVDYSGYALAEVEGGVVAFELTGYADPSPRVLAALSALGGAAAVSALTSRPMSGSVALATAWLSSTLTSTCM